MTVIPGSSPHCRGRDERSAGLRSVKCFAADQPDHRREVVVEVAVVSAMGEEEPRVLEAS